MTENIRQRRRPENRIGFALQLCALRYPGRALAPGEMIPREVLSFVGAQLEFRLMRFSLMPHGAKPVSSTWTRCAKFTATRPSRAVVPVICGSGLSAAEDARSNEDLAHRFIVRCRETSTILPPQYRQSSACARMLWSPLSGGLKRGLRKI